MKDLLLKFVGCNKCLTVSVMLILCGISALIGDKGTFDRIANQIVYASTGVVIFPESNLQPIPGTIVQ